MWLVATVSRSMEVKLLSGAITREDRVHHVTVLPECSLRIMSIHHPYEAFYRHDLFDRRISS